MNNGLLSNDFSQEYYEENIDLFLEKFPKLALVHYENKNHYSFLRQNGILNAKTKKGELIEKLSKEKNIFFKEDTQVIYVFGLGLGYIFLHFEKWLERKNFRHLVFIEEDLFVFSTFLHTRFAKKILTKENVQFVYAEKNTLDTVLEELSQTFPYLKAHVFASPYCLQKKKKTFEKIKEKLLEKTILSEAMYKDRFHSHVLLKNFLENLRFLAKSFNANQLKNKFSRIPAVICGAGPSLEKTVPHLKELEDKTLIIAGGSAIAALTAQNILPHIAMAIDPNLEEMDRLKNSFGFEIPFFYCTRVFPGIFSTFNGLLGYMRTALGGALELWMDEMLSIKEDLISKDLSDNALSITTLCMAFAHYLGCSPILFAGVDLSYANRRKYAAGVLQSEQNLDTSREFIIQKKDKRQKLVQTTQKWVMESKSISDFSKLSQSQFIDVTDRGLKFEGVRFENFEKFIQTKPLVQYDMRNWVYREIRSCEHIQKEGKIAVSIERFYKSLLRAIELIEKILNELKMHRKTFMQNQKYSSSSIMVLAQMDLMEEEAVKYLFYDFFQIANKYLNGKFPMRRSSWEFLWRKEKIQWLWLYKKAQNHRKLFESYLNDAL